MSFWLIKSQHGDFGVLFCPVLKQGSKCWVFLGGGAFNTLALKLRFHQSPFSGCFRAFNQITLSSSALFFQLWLLKPRISFQSQLFLDKKLSIKGDTHTHTHLSQKAALLLSLKTPLSVYDTFGVGSRHPLQRRGQELHMQNVFAIIAIIICLTGGGRSFTLLSIPSG